MPFGQAIQFLRDRARCLLEMAEPQTALSDQLKMIAAELDALADGLERDLDRQAADGGSDGPGPPIRARLAIVGDPLDRREDRLLGRDTAPLGAAG